MVDIFFHQTYIKAHYIKACNNIRKISISQRDDYTTGFLLVLPISKEAIAWI